MGRGRASRAGRWRTATVVFALGGVSLLAGCGAESHPNEPRPQVATRVSVTVNDGAVTVSPQRIAFGPEQNQQIPQNKGQPQPDIGTDAPLDVVFVTANNTESEAELEVVGPTNARSGPLLADSPGTFQADLPTGTYVIAAAGVPTARPGKLVVGPYRASSENDVLLP